MSGDTREALQELIKQWWSGKDVTKLLILTLDHALVQEEKKVIKKQVIVTWYTPDEKLPENDNFVIATISGDVSENVTYDHGFAIGYYCDDEGWWFECTDLAHIDGITVHAWCDLEVYEG